MRISLIFWLTAICCYADIQDNLGLDQRELTSGSGWECEPLCQPPQICADIGGLPTCMSMSAVDQLKTLEVSAGEEGCKITCGPQQTCRLVDGSPQCIFMQPVRNRAASIVFCHQLPEPHCRNRGFCKDQESGFVCLCPSGFTGRRCDSSLTLYTQDDICSSSDCDEQCSCVPSAMLSKGYECVKIIGGNTTKCPTAPKVYCDPTMITIEASRRFIETYTSDAANSFVYLCSSAGEDCWNSSSYCKASFVNNTYRVSIPIPFGDCATNRSVASGSHPVISFSNQLWINRHMAFGLLEMPVPLFKFQCIYKKDYLLTTGIHPLIESRRVMVTEYGQFDLQGTLCKTFACPICPETQKVRAGAIYVVGEMLHLSIAAVSSQTNIVTSSLMTTIDEMYLSCSPVRDAEKVKDLVMHGCPWKPGFPMSLAIGGLHMFEPACASFHLPFIPRCSFVYIHIRARLCERGYSLECPHHPTLRRCFSLSKRSLLHSDVNMTSNTIIGPIVMIDAEAGSKSIEIFHDEKGEARFPSDVINNHDPTKETSRPINRDEFGQASFAILGLGGGLLMSAMLLLCVFVRKHRMLETHESSLLVNN